jgi:hypothetical protein
LAELAHEGVFPLAGRTPLESVADQLVADMHANADTSEVQSFIEGELAPSVDRPATAASGNFAAAPTTAVEGRHNADDDDWMEQLEETTTATTPTQQQQKTERKNEDDDDIVSYSQKAKKKPQQPEESASSRQQLEAFFDDDEEDTETRRMKKKVKEEEEEEEEDSSATDASVIAERFGSRVTFGGMFCKGEFFTTNTRQEHENEGSKNDIDDDERSTLLHGYINSIAVIMPPKSYHQLRKEK